MSTSRHVLVITGLTLRLLATAQVVVNDSADILVTQREFRYKELQESWLDSLDAQHVEWLFGTWTLQEIADVGGTIQTERSVRAQIGKRVILNSDSIFHQDIFNDVVVKDPAYALIAYDSNDMPSLKGTTYWFGYRPARDRVYFLTVNGNSWFEVISVHEMASYYDGRIYLFEKD